MASSESERHGRAVLLLGRFHHGFVFVTGDTRPVVCSVAGAKQCHCSAKRCQNCLRCQSHDDHVSAFGSTYVGRMLRLTSLAPDIIEAILHGDEPDGLSLEKLRKNLPVRWE